MGKSEKIKYWVDIADYDLKTAKAMLDTKRYLYVGFMCHQVVEKILKALYTKLKNDTPPYTHNLLFLSQECGLIADMEESKINFLKELLPLNIEARYPSYKDYVYKKLRISKTEEMFDKTKEFLKWIKGML
jgi:HEPN domain-containing protein